MDKKFNPNPTINPDKKKVSVSDQYNLFLNNHSIDRLALSQIMDLSEGKTSKDLEDVKKLYVGWNTSDFNTLLGMLTEDIKAKKIEIR